MGWFRRGNVKKIASSRVDPAQAVPLYLDGPSSWRTRTGPEQAQYLAHMPAGTEITVDAIPQAKPEPAVALYYGPTNVGHLVGQHAVGLAPAIDAAISAGYRVLMQAKRIDPDPAGIYVVMGNQGGPSDSMLEVRSTLSADLYYWLQLPPEQRALGFFQLNWVGTVYQSYYQRVRRDLLGKRDSVIHPCTFSTAQRHHDPYPDESEYGTKPGHPAIGTFADVYAAGQYIGELRLGARNQNDADVLKILNGCTTGMARLDRRREYIELRVCIADPDGRLPISTTHFMWRSERQAAAAEARKPTLAAWEAEKIDGRPVYTYKNEFRGYKEAGELDKARELGLRMVEAAERVATITNEPPNRWYTWETAIIMRKLKDKEGERALLERFLQHCPPGKEDAKIAERLDKLR